MGNPPSERANCAACSVIACKTLHTLRNCQLPKGSEISNFGNKNENSKQSWATGEQGGEDGGQTDALLCAKSDPEDRERERERERDYIVDAATAAVATGG